jgi:ion channel POLLUX/CASTOR
MNWLKFRLERLVLRGAHYRLLVIAALIGLLSVVAGAVIHLAGAGVEGGFPGAIWWAFLRLSDPGYLGDDEGTLRRLVSTVLTVLGYVVFLGALVAIMTQWLNQRMRELEAGLTPIAQRDHVLIIGWTNRTPTIVQELVMAGPRVRRFLQLHGARSLRIAILAEEVTTALDVELRERLGSWWNQRQVILRSGTPLRIEHLQRVDFIHASAVIMPAADFGTGGPDHADSRTVKTLLSMTNHPQADRGGGLPLVVAEVFDSGRADIARRAYGGPMEVLASDAIVSRLIAQSIRHRGLSHVYGELLTHGRGNEIYVRSSGDLAGSRYADLPLFFEQAVLLGIVRPADDTFRPLLNPDGATIVGADDRLVLMARTYESTTPRSNRGATRPPVTLAPLPPSDRSGVRRVLLLGWNHKVPALLQEFDSYVGEQFEVDIISTVSAARRRALLERHAVQPGRTVVRHVEADFATPAVLERAEVGTFRNIVLLGSDRFESGEESDARSVLGYLLLRGLLPPQDGPALLIELLDAGNAALFREIAGEVIISPLLLSHMLAQVALRRELRVVFDELFGPGGAEIGFRRPAEYGLLGVDASFAAVEAAAAARGETALGVRSGAPGRNGAATLSLNPPRAQQWRLRDEDRIVALTGS